MAKTARSKQRPFTNSVVESLGTGRSEKSLQKFCSIVLHSVHEGDFNEISPATIAKVIRSAWDFIATRNPRKHNLRIYNPGPELPGLGDTTIIEVLNADMPFLVDSVMGEIQERGLKVQLVLHPVLRVVRDSRNKLRSITGRTGPAPEHSVKESYIQVHVYRIGDAAERRELARSLDQILKNVAIVVKDWRAMLERLDSAIVAYTTAPPSVPVSDLAESIQFLKWLLDNNFTFLGMRAFSFVGGKKRGKLKPIPGSGLGILRDPSVYVLRRGTQAMHMTPEIRAFFLRPAPLIVTKANVRSTVHRRAYMDYIGVKIYGEKGDISGELRIVGLFTSTAYTRSTRNIPFLRQKVEVVLNRSANSPDSHSGKALLNVLETFPRDELFQIGVDDLYETAVAIQSLDLKPRTRAFARPDEFDRFVSVIVFVPRDRYSTTVRARIGEFLAETYNGRVSAYFPFFPEGPLVRIHFIIGRSEGETPVRSQEFLDENIERIVRTWEDHLNEALVKGGGGAGTALARKYQGAFSAAYQSNFTTSRAVKDIKELEGLSEESPVAADFWRSEDDRSDRVRVTLYHLHGSIPLSRRVPVLENMGFSVIDERSYRVTRADDDASMSLHDMVLEHPESEAIERAEIDADVEDCFLAVWKGLTGSDGFNKLVLSARLDWREAAVIRAYGSYLRQIGAPFGQAYLAETMRHHAHVTRNLMQLFRILFDPETGQSPESRRKAAKPVVRAIREALEAIPSLDEDRIIRHYLNLIRTTLRTNFYQTAPDGGPFAAITFKFDSVRVEGAPDPKPFAEIYVFSPEVEGIHLRGGRIARGGLRWSDRAQDFRTEVLGLAKAQQVKNVVIVPTGSKGGFVPKYLAQAGTREETLEVGISAYRQFVGSLLRLTDNLSGEKVIPPPDTVRYDADDPYLVVAADKGTATFSDFANEISIAHNFWLGDAFASGGSAGYDHKKMGITARGGWEAVKRHFRELNWDIQNEPFRASGIGDMSGDVFGNGMLLSKKTKLIAAFDHRDIFIDPDPDPETSWRERKRLFGLARSSWQDYNPELISKGGGVFSRMSKSIRLTREIKEITGLEANSVTPNEMIRALLKSPFDLLWFGGIGTYVGGTDESADEIGDRANDAIRITADELNVKVVGEGANLGMTQDARIEYALRGGRVNTDAIDNSAGVNSSDLEVNIKIALGSAVAAGKITLPERNKILAKMTNEVAEACLENNYLQTLAISLGQRRGLSDLGFQQRLMRQLENIGLLNRAIEFLPDDVELAERQQSGQGLTRPELAVLLAYSKIELYNELIDSRVPDDPYFERELEAYFPKTLLKAFPAEIASHRLRREIIATRLSNEIINRGGSTASLRLKEETGRGVADVVLAYTAALGVFGLEALFFEIDNLDNKISGETQLDLYLRVQDLVRAQSGWFLRHVSLSQDLTGTITAYRTGLEDVAGALESILPEAKKLALTADQQGLTDAGAPPSLARSLAEARVLMDVPDAVMVAQALGQPVKDVAAVLFDTAAFLRLDELKIIGEELFVTDYYDRLAINAAMSAISNAQRVILQDVVRARCGQAGAFEAWRNENIERSERTRKSVDEILDSGDPSLSRLMVAVGHLRDLSPT